MDKKAAEKAIEFKKHIGRVIRKHRKQKGKIQYDLAGDLDIKEATLSRYERGKSEIKASTMAEISHICDFDMIEYILIDGESLSKKFQYLARIAGRQSIVHGEALEEQWESGYDRGQDVYHDMQFATASVSQKTRRPKEDILYREPDNYPLPLCDDDSRDFEVYVYSNGMTDKRRILIYGYELLKLYENIDSPWNSMEALAKQLLRRLLREPSGGIDQRVYDYYWKCVYSK